MATASETLKAADRAVAELKAAAADAASRAEDLTDALAEACDVNVKIPMRGRADSLNLAVATGIMVYAVTDKA